MLAPPFLAARNRPPIPGLLSAPGFLSRDPRLEAPRRALGVAKAPPGSPGRGGPPVPASLATRARGGRLGVWAARPLNGWGWGPGSGPTVLEDQPGKARGLSSA